jgi:hypothetical protein
MEPHVQRLSQLQDNIQRLPALIHAVTVIENSKKIQPVGNYKCVDRLFADVENFEDRIEALNEIMEAQRQRVRVFFSKFWSNLIDLIFHNFFDISVGKKRC